MSAPSSSESFGDFFFTTSGRNGNKICQIDADTNRSETFASVRQRSIRLAIQLKEKGITSEDVIVSCCHNSLDNAVAIIASWYLGAKVANLDPTLSERNTKHLLSLVSPRLIFVDESAVDLIETSLNHELNPEIVVLGNSDKYSRFRDLVKPSTQEARFKPSKVDFDDTAIMFFSSGTTGLPKAICHSHSSFLQLVETALKCGYDNTIVLHFTTFYWISGIYMLMQLFWTGGTRVFARTVDGEGMFKIIEKYKVATVFVAPLYTYKLTSVPNPERYDLSSFRFLLTSGTPLSFEQHKKLIEIFPKVRTIFFYAMTEVGVVSIFHPVRDKVFLKTKPSSCGKVVPLTSLKIVDPDTEETLGPNKKGEIRVKSPGVMSGYHNLDSTDCFDSDGFLKTGDVGYLNEDDCLHVVDRLKEMFKYLSWHIVPSAIEAVLLEHPAVKEAVVFGFPAGEEGEVPAACLVLKDGLNVAKDEIEKFVQERVSDRERLRGGVTFVKSLPRTPTGKAIRKDVKDYVLKLI